MTRIVYAESNKRKRAENLLLLLAEIATNGLETIPEANSLRDLALLVENGYVESECGEWIPTQAGVDLLAEFNLVG